MNQSFFNYATGLTMTNSKFSNLFGQNVRKSETELLTQFHMDIAASIQSATEEVILKIAKYLNKEYNISNLCMAGGVALNCVANAKILESGYFKNLWIQPAAGDAGGAIGAALSVWHKELKKIRKVNKSDSMKGSFLGPEYNQNDVENLLTKCGAKYDVCSEKEIIDLTVESLKKGKAVGWFQGKMEFGPRALGARSIIGDPRNKEMQTTINLKIKRRESFRPFAPTVLAERLNEYFALEKKSTYMLLISKVKGLSMIEEL